MSRSGYSDCYDLDHWSLIMYRGAVSRALSGARGQAFLKELIATLDAMPEKRLIAEAFKVEDGAACALGAVGLKRGTDLSDLNVDPMDDDGDGAVVAAKRLGIAAAMAREIVWINDEGGRHDETPEQRWQRVRKWAASELLPDDYVRVLR
jgi:hypothetical protein